MKAIFNRLNFDQTIKRYFKANVDEHDCILKPLLDYPIGTDLFLIWMDIISFYPVQSKKMLLKMSKKNKFIEDREKRKQEKNELVVRTYEDVKNSQVKGYKYLIP